MGKHARYNTSSGFIYPRGDEPIRTRLSICSTTSIERSGTEVLTKISNGYINHKMALAWSTANSPHFQVAVPGFRLPCLSDSGQACLACRAALSQDEIGLLQGRGTGRLGRGPRPASWQMATADWTAQSSDIDAEWASMIMQLALEAIATL